MTHIVNTRPADNDPLSTILTYAVPKPDGTLTFYEDESGCTPDDIVERAETMVMEALAAFETGSDGINRSSRWTWSVAFWIDSSTQQSFLDYLPGLAETHGFVVLRAERLGGEVGVSFIDASREVQPPERSSA